jgi:Zn-dependent M16 (insulinase) family peptidase
MAAPAALTSPLRGCAASDVLSGAMAQAVVASLSAIESTYLLVSAPGVGAYDVDHAPLLVVIEYLTALEGDFWVKIRGAGLAYGELGLGRGANGPRTRGQA